MSSTPFNTREQQARAAKALTLLDALCSLRPEPITGDAVRALSDAGWERLEMFAGTNPASPQTREIVATLADTRVKLAAAVDDPFAAFDRKPDTAPRYGR